MKKIKKIFGSALSASALFLIAQHPIFAEESQQYVEAQTPPQAASSPPPIYVTPQNPINTQNQLAYQQPDPALKPAATAPQTSASAIQALPQAVAQSAAQATMQIPPRTVSQAVTQATMQTTIQAAPQILNNAPPQNASPQNAAQSFANGAPTKTYTKAEQDAWMKSCVEAINNKQALEFASEFCTCGWEHISSGQLAPELLTDTSSQGEQQRNSVMHMISEQCVVETMAKHNI